MSSRIVRKAADPRRPERAEPDGGPGGDSTPALTPAACQRRCANGALGVNVAGYLDTESGMGEAARASIRSLQAAGIPFALNNGHRRCCGPAT